MAKAMTKSDIVNHLSKKLGTTKKLSTQFVDEFVGLAYKEAKKNFVIPGLGKLHVASRKRRKGRNPATGEAIIIPAKNVKKEVLTPVLIITKMALKKNMKSFKRK